MWTPSPARGSFHVAVIGGGDATTAARVLAELPLTLDMAVIVAVPMSPAVIESASKLPVEVVTERAPLVRGTLYVFPPDKDARLVDGHLVVTASERGFSLDALFRSLADDAGHGGVAVVLAGRGTAGALGLQRVKEAGGWTLAQDAVGELGEMTRTATATGLVDLVLPVERVAGRLARSIAATLDDQASEDDESEVADTLRDILTLVRVRSGHDFSSYKRATMHRRMSRRMLVCECDTLAGYHRYLRDHPAELANLLRDFLISVTQFFRDPATFDVLEHSVIPKLFADKGANDQVRLWVSGCATGEEAYSLGILLLEHASRARVVPQIQIFATDIDDKALTIARLGRYPDSIANDITAPRLDRYFTREGGQYRVNKELRALVLFSPHDVLRDPPFSRLDFVSCRNLLIYLDREAQNRVLTMFHFGLRQDGMLLLGSSESAESSSTFSPVDSRHRIFVRRPSSSGMSDSAAASSRWNTANPTSPRGMLADRPTPPGELHHRLVEFYAPPSVLVSGELDIVHLSEHAGRYFHIGGGEPSRQLLRLVIPELRFDLRTAIYAARQKGSDARTTRIETDTEIREVEIRARVVDVSELGRGAVLVTFSEVATKDIPAAAPTRTDNSAMEPVVREIEDELHRTRDQLRTTVEQYETSLEELKASNEELQAINEELRSATEELETSKEELQSVNEELTTLNHELKGKVDEVSHANSDLQNLMTSTEIGVIFLDRQLHIKRFTPRVQDLFNLLPSDLGRPIAHLTHRLDCEDLVEVASSVLQTLRSVERKVTSRDGRSWLARWLPYRSVEDRIDGVVLTFVDVSEVRDAVAAQKRSEVAQLRAEEHLSVAMRSAPIAVLAFENGVVIWGFLMGNELTATERAELGMFAPGDGERLSAIARRVVRQRTGESAELDLYVGDTLRTFDFRVEVTALGVTAVGFERARVTSA